jgi:hypothetical protein
VATTVTTVDAAAVAAFAAVGTVPQTKYKQIINQLFCNFSLSLYEFSLFL